jgi:hypothetical protein
MLIALRNLIVRTCDVSIRGQLCGGLGYMTIVPMSLAVPGPARALWGPSAGTTRGAAISSSASLSWAPADGQPVTDARRPAAASSSYFPGPVRGVEIPKDHGEGMRLLGVPNTADRVAQTAAAVALEEGAAAEMHRRARPVVACAGLRDGPE